MDADYFADGMHHLVLDTKQNSYSIVNQDYVHYYPTHPKAFFAPRISLIGCVGEHERPDEAGRGHVTEGSSAWGTRWPRSLTDPNFRPNPPRVSLPAQQQTLPRVALIRIEKQRKSIERFAAGCLSSPESFARFTTALSQGTLWPRQNVTRRHELAQPRFLMEARRRWLAGPPSCGNWASPTLTCDTDASEWPRKDAASCKHDMWALRPWAGGARDPDREPGDVGDAITSRQDGSPLRAGLWDTAYRRHDGQDCGYDRNPHPDCELDTQVRTGDAASVGAAGGSQLGRTHDRESPARGNMAGLPLSHRVALLVAACESGDMPDYDPGQWAASGDLLDRLPSVATLEGIPETAAVPDSIPGNMVPEGDTHDSSYAAHLTDESPGLGFNMGFEDLKGDPFEIHIRPQKRELSQDTQEQIDIWFASSNISLGKMVPPDRRADTKRMLYTWRDKFATSLNDMKPSRLLDHKIFLEEGAKPFQMRQHRYTAAQVDYAKYLFPSMELADIIERCDSEWAANTIWVYRGPFKEPRTVHDYRPINSATVKSQYPVHDMESDLDCLANGRPTCYAKSDASWGYWGVQMFPPHRKYTAFRTPNGQWAYKRMAMGLKNSMNTYARLGDLAFGFLPPRGTGAESFPSVLGHMPDLKSTLVLYVDDHCMSFADFESGFRFLHDHYFPRIDFASIPLAGKKTELFTDSLDSVGFTLKDGKVIPAEKHRQRFAQWAKTWSDSPPATWEEALALLNLTPFLRRFIPGRAELVLCIKRAFWEQVPKTTPTGKKSVQMEWKKRDTPVWTPQQTEAVTRVCHSIQKVACCGPQYDKAFHLATDASNTATGAVLFHLGAGASPTEEYDAAKHFDGIEIVQFMSFKLTDGETRYSTPERETLAVVRALKETEWMLRESRFRIHVYTDHLSIIQTLTNLSETHSKITRWVETLTAFDFHIHHRPNTDKMITLADGMSRLPANLQSAPLYPLDEQPGPEFDMAPFDKLVRRPEAKPMTRHLDETARENKTRENMPRGGQLECRSETIAIIQRAEEGVRATTNVPPFDQPEGLAASTLDTDPVVVLPFAPLTNPQHRAKLESAVMTPGMEVWYGDVIRFLIYGDEALEGMSAARRRNTKRKAIKFRIMGDQLRYVETDDSLAVCTPPEGRAAILRWVHDGHGHYADKITLRELRGRYWWPTRCADVQAWCRRCHVCAQTGYRMLHAPGRMIGVFEPMALVGMDFLGPLTPPAKDGSKYILVAVDYFSRMIFTEALAEATGFTVCSTWMRRWSPLVGWPRQTYSDNGSHFRNTVCHAVFQNHGAEMLFGPVSHPQSTGLSERMVRMIKQQLMKWALGKRGVGLEEWHLALAKLTIDINTRRSPSLGVTPAEAFLGFNPMHARDDESRRPGFTEDQVEAFENDDDADEMMWGAATMAFIDARDEAREQLAGRRVQAGEAHESKRAGPVEVLVEGTWVWEKRDKPGDEHSKFKPVWKGPYSVVRPASSVSYFVRPVTGDGKIRKIHVTDLKLYHPRLEWMKDQKRVGTRVDDYDLFRELDQRGELMQYGDVYHGRNALDLGHGCSVSFT